MTFGHFEVNATESTYYHTQYCSKDKNNAQFREVSHKIGGKNVLNVLNSLF